MMSFALAIILVGLIIYCIKEWRKRIVSNKQHSYHDVLLLRLTAYYINVPLFIAS